jgi:hypothetical protein
MEILRFSPEVPVEVALKFPTGKLVQGNHGPDMMYTLADGRLMFLDQLVAAQLDTLRIVPGEPFWITRNAGRPGVKGSVSWDIRRPRAQAPQTQLAAAPRPPANGAPPIFWPEEGNGHAAAANGHTAAAVAVKTQAESAVMTAIEACSKGEKYAASIGYACHFEHEDVRSIADTILIGMQKNGGQR